MIVYISFFELAPLIGLPQQLALGWWTGENGLLVVDNLASCIDKRANNVWHESDYRSFVIARNVFNVTIPAVNLSCERISYLDFLTTDRSLRKKAVTDWSQDIFPAIVSLGFPSLHIIRSF